MDLMTNRPAFGTEEASRLVLENYGIEGKTMPLPGERDQNFVVETADGTRHVLKIANRLEDPQILEAQNRAMSHLARTVDLTPRIIPSTNGDEVVTLADAGGNTYSARLVSWVPGIPLASLKRQSDRLLRNLGRTVGRLDRAFAGFDHPAVHREFHWDLARGPEVIAGHRQLIGDPEIGDLVDRALDLYRRETLPLLPGLRTAVIHNDANDHNVIVGGGDTLHTRNQQVTGIIDFGDMVHSHVAGNLAVAAAYAVLDKPSPLAAACRLVEGYHAEHPLTEEELAALFGMVCLRQAVSICVAARQARERPDDPYLTVSQAPIRRTLPRLLGINPGAARMALRHACGLAPDPRAEAVRVWLAASRGSFAPVLPPAMADAPMTDLDLGIGSPLVSGDPEVYREPELSRRIRDRMAGRGATVGVGLYDEPRIIYASTAFKPEGAAENRTVHLGIDLFVEPGTAIHAPLEGTVHLFGNNAAPQDYGPVIILRHATDDGEPFFTLYGHLSENSLDGLEAGQPIGRGEAFAAVGDATVNGNWPPHLHLQLITDLLGMGLDFPGVCAHAERSVWCALSPDPDLVLGLPEGVLPPPKIPKAETRSVRRTLIGPNLSVGYHDPVKAERGWMQYLYDETGRRYLDAYNNVPHLGHGHPRAVQAVADQMAVLSTNTRYLHDTINRFARKLTATMPEPLSVCYFVNSASEGNELALRLARARTGQMNMIVLEAAYHGHCNALIDISPYKHGGPGGRGAPAWVHTAPIPDTYRGPYKQDDPEAGPKYAGHVAELIEGLQANGEGLCGFIAESYPSVGGQIIVPPGYLRTVYQAVRRAGGVCIADEVQTGYGRIGTHFYAFEAQDAIPDIVVLGKPIGNGHPLSAVVTTPEIAGAFDNGMEFFSTFGGNTVSCTVGLAVLEETLKADLQGHALEVGNRLLAGLAPLADRFPIVGDVRGSGLFAGVELVRDRETLEPAGEEASFVIDRMRDRGILAGTDGPYHNVVKIRPPMPFTAENADHLAAVMKTVLEEEFAE
jgi:4-aminobutyrate aminotransferase-like enzyme/Ser/Thr protein kinase RdoA (MazF antagonist)